MTKIFLSTTALIIGMQATAYAQGMADTEVVSSKVEAISKPAQVQKIYIPERMEARAFPEGSTDQVIEMENFIYNVAEAEGIVDVFYTDMSGDGQAEALVIMDDCDADGTCSWRLYAHRGGNIAIVGGDRAADVSFAGTEGGGAVVWSDGVTWAYGGYSAYPFGSVLEQLSPSPGTATDLDVINAQDEFSVTKAASIDVYLADFLPEVAGAERFYQVRGLENSYGAMGYPYALADDKGRLLDYGFSIDTPAVFLREDDGLAVLTNGPQGMSVTIIAGDEDPEQSKDSEEEADEATTGDANQLDETTTGTAAGD